MTDDRLDSQNLKNDDEGTRSGSNSNEGAEFESDTQKLTRKHLEDEDHVITEEEMRNLRVGMTPPVLDEATEVRFSDDEEVEKEEEKFIGDVDEIEDETAKRKITPWDTIDPA